MAGVGCSGALRAALPVGLAAAVLAAPAAAPHPPALVGAGDKELRRKAHRWLHQSRMPLVRGRIRLIVGACPGVPRFSGCVFTRNPRRLYLRPDARSPKSVLYHELGHTFDLTLLRPDDRRGFRRILHLGKRRWFAGDPSPSELFAESYALCARFGRKRPAIRRLGWTGSVYGYRPTRRQHRAVCDLIRLAGGERRQRRHPKPQPPPNAPPRIEQEPPQPPPRSSPQPSNPGPVPPLPHLPIPVPPAVRWL